MTSRAERIDAVGYDYAARKAEPVVRCNLCGSDRLARVTERDRYGYPASASVCEDCSLVFLDPRMDADGYAEFYAKWYRPIVSAYHGREISAATLPDDQRRYAASLRDWLGEALAGRAVRSLLDVGGSTGIVAAALRDRFGAEATVLDPSPEELEVAAALGLRTAAGFVEDYAPPAGARFDLVALCQTADHLLDVASALAKIRELVADDGLFFVDIVDALAVADAKGGLVEAIKVDHPYYFSDATIRAALARAGFRVVATRPAADQHLDYLCAPQAAEPGALPDADVVARDVARIRALAARRAGGA